MSPAEWWGSRDTFPGDRQVAGSGSAVTAGSVPRGLLSFAMSGSTGEALYVDTFWVIAGD